MTKDFVAVLSFWQWAKPNKKNKTCQKFEGIFYYKESLYDSIWETDLVGKTKERERERERERENQNALALVCFL